MRINDTLTKGQEKFKEVINRNLIYTDIVLQKTFGTFTLINKDY